MIYTYYTIWIANTSMVGLTFLTSRECVLSSPLTLATDAPRSCAYEKAHPRHTPTPQRVATESLVCSRPYAVEYARTNFTSQPLFMLITVHTTITVTATTISSTTTVVNSWNRKASWKQKWCDHPYSLHNASHLASAFITYCWPFTYITGVCHSPSEWVSEQTWPPWVRYSKWWTFYFWHLYHHKVSGLFKQTFVRRFHVDFPILILNCTI